MGSQVQGQPGLCDKTISQKRREGGGIKKENRGEKENKRRKGAGEGGEGRNLPVTCLLKSKAAQSYLFSCAQVAQPNHVPSE